MDRTNEFSKLFKKREDVNLLINNFSEQKQIFCKRSIKKIKKNNLQRNLKNLFLLSKFKYVNNRSYI